MGVNQVADKRKVHFNSDVSPISTTTYAAMQSNATLDARLAAVDAAYYTAARLQTMSRNDKEYALRQLSESAGI